MTAVEKQSDQVGPFGPFGSGAAFLILITFLAYLPALDGEFIWDDDAYVVDNATLSDLDGLRRIWFEVGATPQYYPMVFSSYWLENQIYGRQPFHFHLVNICLHLLNAFLLVRVLSLLRVPGAFLAGALFAVHPVAVESVAWISERKNVLSTAFYLLAMLCYLRFLELPGTDGMGGKGGEGGKGSRKFGYAATWLSFAAALLSKSVTASLPFAVLLLTWWKRGRLVLRDWLLAVPFLAAGVLMTARTAWVEANIVGTEKIAVGLSLLERVAVAGRALWFYLGKLLLPLDLTFIYPRFDLSEFAWWQPAAPLLAVLLALSLYGLRRRIGRGPLVAALFFGGTLVPALGFVDFFPMIYSYVADHFQYLAMLGPLALFGALLVRALGGTNSRRLWLAAGALLFASSFQTWRHCHAFQSTRALFEDTLEKNPDAVMASINLANMAARETHDLSRSHQLLMRAKQVDPALVHPLVRAKLEYAIGSNLVDAGRHDEGIQHFVKAREIFPHFWDPVFAIGRALALKGDLEGAVAQFELMLKYIPDHQPTREWLARTRERLRQRN